VLTVEDKLMVLGCRYLSYLFIFFISFYSLVCFLLSLYGVCIGICGVGF
jgi:hypothetical protein